MELRQLEYFSTVSALKNFTKAARFLHVSQPSVTKAIQSLEAELKLTLLDRSQKHVCLTEAGQVFLIHVKKILQDVKAAQIAMERFQDKNAGVIRFGVPPILIDLQECSDSLSIHENLENGVLDLGIVYLQADDVLKNSLKFLDDEFYLCLPLNHRLATSETISFQSLRDEKFILQPAGTFQNFATLQQSANAGFSPEILLSTSQLKTIKELVSSGAAVALLPRFAITPESNFKSVPLDPPIKFSLALTWSKFKELSPLCIRFLKFVDLLFHEDLLAISPKKF